MENEVKISLEEIKNKVDEKISQFITEKLNSTYDNPIKNAVDEEFKGVDGVVRLRVKDLMKTLIQDKSIEQELLDHLKNQIIKKILN